MSNLFKIQYQNAKEILDQMNTNTMFYNQCTENNEVAEYIKLKDEYMQRNIKLLTSLCLIAGIKCNIFSNGSIHTDSLIFCEYANDIFQKYEQELLANNLIEFGDTLTDEQKLAYYYEQEMQMRMNEDFFL